MNKGVTMNRGARPHYQKKQKPRKDYNWYYPNLAAEMSMRTTLIKQNKLAQRCGISPVTLCKLLRGTYTLHKPPLTENQKTNMAQLLNLRKGYLFKQKTR